MKVNKAILIPGLGIATIGLSFLAYKKIKRLSLLMKIVRTAKKYIGEREITPNQGFVNKAFEKLLRDLGNWLPGYEWCACFARMIWLFVLTGKKREIAAKLLSPSSQQTYNNFSSDKSGLFEVSEKPKPGAIIIWQSKKEPHKGHEGIYITKLGRDYVTIEGNKGQKVSICKYTPEQMKNPSNILKLRGFINIK